MQRIINWELNQNKKKGTMDKSYNHDKGLLINFKRIYELIQVVDLVVILCALLKSIYEGTCVNVNT